MTDPEEECDDANLDPGDGCSPECVLSGGVLWERRIESERGVDDVARGLAVGVDGQLVVVGGTGAEAMEQMLLASCPDDGAECQVWTRDGGAIGQTRAWATAAYADGSFAVGGRERFGEGETDGRGWFGRTSTSEEVQWSGPVRFGDQDVIRGLGIDATQTITAVGHTGSEAWIERRDEDGGELWSSVYGGPGTVAYAVATSAAGESVVVGAEPDDAGSVDVWLRRFTIAGAGSVTVRFTGPGSSVDAAYGVTILPTGDVAVVGESEDQGWISWFAVGGAEPIRNQRVEGTTVLWAVAATPNGDVVAVGDTSGAESPRGWIGRFDPEGIERWSVSSERSTEDHHHAVAIDASGRLFVAGEANFDGNIDAVLLEVTP